MLSNDLQLIKRTKHERSVDAGDNLTMIQVPLIAQRSTLDINFIR